MNVFEGYLGLGVAARMALGVALGGVAKRPTGFIGTLVVNSPSAFPAQHRLFQSRGPRPG